MRIFSRNLLFSLCLTLGLAAVASAGSMSPLQVKVTRSSGKVVYEGESGSSGTFSTPQLAPGNYVVQLNAKSAPKGGPVSVVIDDTGKGSTTANSIAPSKFAKGGVALKVTVGPKPMSMTGHLTHGTAAATTASASAGAAAPKEGVHMENGKKVKYEKGTKYVWVEGISAMGGHWALASSPEANHSQLGAK